MIKTTKQMKNQVIEAIKNSKFSNDSELKFTMYQMETDNYSPLLLKNGYYLQSTLKRIATLERGSVNLPTNLFESHEVELIEEYLLNNEWSVEDINDANAYKGKYWIYDNTDKEIRLYFFMRGNELFVEHGAEYINLSK